MIVWKDENKQKKMPGMAHLKKKPVKQEISDTFSREHSLTS